MTTFRYRSQFALVVTAMLILSGRSQDKPVTSIGAMPVAEILQRLGARQEDGLTDEQHHRYAQQFGGVDRNKDGRHSKEEYVENGRYMTLQARQEIFVATDRDRDGFVSEAEYLLNRVITDEAKAILGNMDDNHDRLVQKSEFEKYAVSLLDDAKLIAEVFAAWDGNEDGQLVIPEYLRVWGNWAREGQPPAAKRLAALRIAQLDAYWAEVSRSVQAGDFEGYQATCHEHGVLVSGSKKRSCPLSKALAGWKQGFQDTKEGKLKAKVTFRFGQRLGDATTAHETGIFLYETEASDGTMTESSIHFEALLTKTDRWRIVMEYQKTAATTAQWEALMP